MASKPPLGAIFGHFEPFWTLFGHLGGGQRPQVGPDPGKIGWGVKIGGSRGPKWRLDPLWGQFLVILNHFGPFFDPFWPFGWGQRLQVGPDPLKLV